MVEKTDRVQVEVFGVRRFDEVGNRLARRSCLWSGL